MKSAIRTIFPSLLLLVSSSFAQEQGDTVETNTPPSSASTGGGLQIDVRTDQERIDFLLQVASVYFKEEDFEAAVDAYERILEIDPSNREARFVVGHVYISAKQYAKAEASLTKLIEEYPDDFQLKNNLAWLYATAEDPAFRDGEQAIRLAQEAMVLAPNDHHVWSTLSEAYYVTGQYEKAYRAIEHMVRVARRYGRNMPPEMLEGYYEQIEKCRRAWDSEKVLNGEEETTDEDTSSPPESDDPVLDTSAEL